MKGRGLALLLLGCGTSRPSALPAEPPPAVATQAPIALPPAAPSPPGTAEAHDAPPHDAPPHGAASAASREPGHDEHPHDHARHGKDGYHMDFSEVERFARHFDGPERDGWQKPTEVVHFLELGTGQVVADVGAGTGYFLQHLAKAVGAGGRVIALDVEPNMVEYIQRRSRRSAWANVEARVVTPDDPGLPAASVDHILIVNTWHHIDDRANYSAKLARTLRPGGSLLIVDFTLESDMGPPKEHRLSAEQVVRELEGGGLRAEIVRGETLPQQYIVRASPPKGASH